MTDAKGFTPAWEVIYLYLLDSNRGRLTRGFATIQTSILTIQTGLKVPELRRTLKEMEAANLLVVHGIDESAVDVAVTAVGLAKYVSREAS